MNRVLLLRLNDGAYPANQKARCAKSAQSILKLLFHPDRVVNDMVPNGHEEAACQEMPAFSFV